MPSDCNSYRNWRDAIDVPNFNAPTFVINRRLFSDTFFGNLKTIPFSEYRV